MNALTSRSTAKNLPFLRDFSDLKIRNEREQSAEKDFLAIQSDISRDMQLKEKFLDDYCDKVTSGVDNPAEKMAATEMKTISTKVFNLQKPDLPKPVKRAPLDPMKKTKLLAALKSIESN